MVPTFGLPGIDGLYRLSMFEYEEGPFEVSRPCCTGSPRTYGVPPLESLTSGFGRGLVVGRASRRGASYYGVYQAAGPGGPPEFVALEHVTLVAIAGVTRSLGSPLGLQTANGRPRSYRRKREVVEAKTLSEMRRQGIAPSTY